MDISLVAPNRPELTNTTVIWLRRLLEQPSLSGSDLPNGIRGYVYINQIPLALTRGSWTIDDNTIYLARTSGTVDSLTKLGILAVIAQLTHARENPGIIELFSTRMVEEIKNLTRVIHSHLIVSPTRPNRLAIDQVNCRVAAEINGAWFLPGGTPVEVDNSWIIMDY